MTTETAHRIYPLGEEGEWMFGEGHIPPADFLARAKAEWDYEEWPDPENVQHVWYVEGHDVPDRYPDGYIVWKNITPETSGAQPATVVSMDL